MKIKHTDNANNDVRQNILAHGHRIIVGKGFAAVGINEVLTAAGVPKGSFYHYFGSKDAFGEALLERYFDAYWAECDAILSTPNLSVAQRLINYWENWKNAQLMNNCEGKCLTVKLGAEVADLSETMRLAIQRGTTGITNRLSAAIKAGLSDGSLSTKEPPYEVAENLYQLWLGASVLVKITRTPRPFETAMAATRQMLHLQP